MESVLLSSENRLMPRLIRNNIKKNCLISKSHQHLQTVNTTQRVDSTMVASSRFDSNETLWFNQTF